MSYRYKSWYVVLLLMFIFLITPTEALCAKSKEKYLNRDKVSYLLLESYRVEELQSKDSLVASFEMLKRILEKDSLNQEANYNISRYYLLMDKPEKYYYCVLNAAISDSTNYYYNLKAADNAMRVEDYSQALSIYQRLIRNNPTDENLYSDLAEAYLYNGDVDSAMACYDKIEYMTENMEYVAYTKAGLYEHLKQYDKAISELQRLLDSDTTNVSYLLSMAEAYLSIDSLELGKAYIDKARALDASCAINLYDMAYYEAKKDKEGMQRSVRTALACSDINYESKSEILKKYISNILNVENYLGPETTLEMALLSTDELFNMVIDEYPRESFIRELYAEVLRMQNRYDEAADQCQSAIYINPSNIDVHRQLIQLLALSKNYEGMNSAIEGAAEYADSTFVIEASTYYYATHQVEKALNSLMSAAEKYKSPIFLSDIYMTIADIYFNQKDMTMPGHYYQLALQNNPENKMLWNNYAYYLTVSGGDLSLAEQLSSKAVRSNPEEPVYLDTYGWVYFKQGKYLFAELYIKKALEKGASNNAEVLEHYGDILFHQDKLEEALKYWQQAYDLLEDKEENKTLKAKLEQKTYINE